MAAGTSRILRYVLFAFFVGVKRKDILALADCVIGHYDALFHIIIVNT